MAVVGVDECGGITDTVTGDSAVVEVQSKDPQAVRGADSYQMVRTGNEWLLSPAEIVKDRPEQATEEQEHAAAHHLIQLIDEVGKAVRAGQCTDVNDVLSRISNGLASP